MKMKWKIMDRNLEKDEIIRTFIKPGEKIYGYKKEENFAPDCSFSVDENKKEGTYIYGRNTGGFGSKINTMGNAIFVNNVSSELEITQKKETTVSERWERHWGIEIMEE
jgi:hypothetical protein